MALRLDALLALWAYAGVASADVLLNEFPFIEAHDSASGYLPGGFIHQINDWTITQPSDTKTAVTTQLKCGARAFDWRPKVNGGKLVMHHGDVEIDHAMADAVQELVTFANANQGDDDIILLAVTDCDGDNCTSMAKSVLTEAGVPTLITDCGRLKGMTLTKALALSKLPGGGHILPVFDCVDEHYDSEIACSGYNSANGTQATKGKLDAKEKGNLYTCYKDSSTKDFPIKRMFSYLDQVSSGGPGDQMWSMQALWQETPESIAIGELHRSDLLQDEVRSGLNGLITDAVKAGRWENINFLEVNNVCDGGPELLKALRARMRARASVADIVVV